MLSPNNQEVAGSSPQSAGNSPAHRKVGSGVEGEQGAPHTHTFTFRPLQAGGVEGGSCVYKPLYAKLTSQAPVSCP